MKVEIISVGSELICGKIKDSNAPFIASRFNEIGLDVTCQTTVGDESGDLKSVLEVSTKRAGLVIITGGLGPTVDDITRETVADFCKAGLIEDEGALKQIEQLTGNAKGQKYVSNLKQAMIPEGSIVVPNSIGTACGFLVKIFGSNIICLPGVPNEMKLMLESWVIPYILRGPGKRKKKCLKIINIIGISESILDKKVRQLIKPDKHLSLSTLVNDGIVSIHIETSDDETEKPEYTFDEVEEKICRELGICVFSKDGEMLEVVVAELLKKSNVTVAVAESCTGGLVSNLLTNVPGSSTFFLEGIISYSNKAKRDLLGIQEGLIRKFGAISPEVAKAMASGVKEQTQADIGLAITGIAGPSGIEDGIDKGKPVGLVYIAMAKNDILECKEYRFFGTRIDIKRRSANAALNVLRICLL